MTTPRAILVHHRASLGDTILLWPLLRALARGEAPAAFASDAAKARLVSRFLGVEAVDAEGAAFVRLWRGETGGAGVRRFARVLWFGAPGEPAARDVLRRSIAGVFGASSVELFTGVVDRPGVERAMRELSLTPSPVAPGGCARGPVVLHVGAGSEEKRWSMERWGAVHAGLAGAGRAVSVIAGEVEFERFGARDRERFAELGGRFVGTLDELADELAAASLVVAGDTGPGHLAAQLGVPTISLFGPTDPARWAPAGPAAVVLAPESPRGMDWLGPEAVLEMIRRSD